MIPNFALEPASFRPCPRPRFPSERASSGYGAAWLARPSGGRKVAGSNPASPTKITRTVMERGQIA